MKLSLLILGLFCFEVIIAQKIDKIINPAEVRRIESVLSDDKMEGRRTFTEGNAKAATFIAGEFESIGLKTFNGAKGFKQEFAITDTIMGSFKGSVNNQPLKEQQVVTVTSQSSFTVTDKSGYDTGSIKAGKALNVVTRSSRSVGTVPVPR